MERGSLEKRHEANGSYEKALARHDVAAKLTTPPNASVAISHEADAHIIGTSTLSGKAVEGVFPEVHDDGFFNRVSWCFDRAFLTDLARSLNLVAKL